MLIVFLVGIAVALLIEDWTGISPGGVVSAAFLALVIDNIPLLLVTALATAGAAGIVLLAERHILLHGRRRFAFAILAGATIKALILLAITSSPLDHAPVALLGFVIPGVIADSCLKQGARRTLPALLLALAVTSLVRLGIGV